MKLLLKGILGTLFVTVAMGSTAFADYKRSGVVFSYYTQNFDDSVTFENVRIFIDGKEEFPETTQFNKVCQVLLSPGSSAKSSSINPQSGNLDFITCIGSAPLGGFAAQPPVIGGAG